MAIPKSTPPYAHISDLDVLIVSDGEGRLKRGGLDLVYVSREALSSPRWLNSELAGHISHYGVWLKGDGEWRANVSVSDDASEEKERRVRSLLCSLAQSWSRLHPCFQRKYRVTIRRELQRMLLLRNAVAVPPTPCLDSQWQSRPDSAALLNLTEFFHAKLTGREILTELLRS